MAFVRMESKASFARPPWIARIVRAFCRYAGFRVGLSFNFHDPLLAILVYAQAFLLSYMLVSALLTNPLQELSFASMAPLSQSASWRRADTVRARSDTAPTFVPSFTDVSLTDVVPSTTVSPMDEEPTTSSPDGPIDLSVPNGEVIDATSMSPAAGVSGSSTAGNLSNGTGIMLTTSDILPSDGDVFTVAAPLISAVTSLGEIGPANIATPNAIPTSIRIAIPASTSAATPASIPSNSPVTSEYVVPLLISSHTQ